MIEIDSKSLQISLKCFIYVKKWLFFEKKNFFFSKFKFIHKEKSKRKNFLRHLGKVGWSFFLKNSFKFRIDLLKDYGKFIFSQNFKQKFFSLKFSRNTFEKTKNIKKKNGEKEFLSNLSI